MPLARRHACLVALLASSSAAWAGGGGGGVSMGGHYVSALGNPTGEAPGLLGCVGGTGFGWNDRGLRVGGEGTVCRGSWGGTSMVTGGGQLGWYHAGSAGWLTAHAGVGLGSLNDTTGSDGRYRSLFAYLKPKFGGGFAWGGAGVEIGVFSMVPLNLVQWVADEDAEGRGVLNMTGGVEVSFLFGRLRKPREVVPWTSPYHAPAAPAPLAVPGPAEPPPPPLDTADGPSLAIPADEVDGYPPPPPPP